jgi:hypothetical protein
MKPIIPLIVAILTLVAGLQAADRKPAILSVARKLSAMPRAAHDQLVVKPLTEAGFEIDVCEQNEIPDRLASGRYNILCWVPMWDVTNDNDIARYKTEFPPIKKAVEDFLSKGGALFMPGPSEQQAIPATWAVTEGWGLHILCERTGDLQTGPEYFGPCWSYASNVSGPASPGVKGVWFPRNGGYPHPGSKWWWPLEVDDTWEVVLKADKELKPAPQSWSPDVDKEIRKKPVPDGVPLAAVRDLKPGRVVVMTLPQTYWFASPHNWPGGVAAMYEGINGKPSDGTKMMINLFKWLAQAPGNEKFGGARTPAELFKPGNMRRVQPAPEVCWNHYYRGLIGARTRISTGKSTVAEYAKAARAAGLDFLVFLEDHKAMTPEKNARLIKECQAVSDHTFQAIPGFTIEDEFGNCWFFAGEKAVYPKDVFLSPDKKVFAAHYNKPELVKNIPEADRNGTMALGYVVCNITGNQYQYQVLSGSWNHRKASMPPWDFRNYNAVALYTFDEKGKLIDDISEDYPLLEQKGNRLEPFCMTLMDSADQVAMHAKNGWFNHVKASSLPALLRTIASWRGDVESDQYISNGPEIVRWEYTRFEYPHLIADEYRMDLYRNPCRLHVRSDVGLKEISIYDGTRLVRRFLTEGAREFKQDLDFYVVPQQYLLVIAQDINGRRAISKDMFFKNPNFQEFLCGDRNNQLFNGYTPRPDGSIFYYAPPTGNSTTPDKGPVCWMMAPARAYTYDEWSPTCPWDGGVIPTGLALSLTPTVSVEGEKELPLHNRTLRILHSYDTQIGEGVIDGGFPEEWRPHIGMVWGSIFPVVPTRFLEGKMRLRYWRLKADTYPVALFEETLGFKKDVTLEGDMPIMIGRLAFQNKPVSIELRDKDGKIQQLQARDLQKPVVVSLEDTGYISIYDSLIAQTFYSFEKGLRVQVAPGWVSFFLAPAEKRVKKGAEFPVRILGVGSNTGLHPESAQKADQAFGLTGGKPAYRVKLEKGRITGQRYQLEIAADRGVVTGQIPKADLPAHLAIQVNGLNPNWTVLYVDRANSRWRPIGSAENMACVVLDPSSADQSFFIGHPVTCDQPEVKLLLTQVAENAWQLEVHNPTDKEVRTQLAFPREFTPLSSTVPSVTLKPGSSVFFSAH